MDELPERYNESLLKKTELTMKENDNVMKKINNNYFKSSPDDVVHHCL